MKGVKRLLPLVLKDQVVEIGNDVVHRAAVVAKRNAAVHATGRLLGGVLFGKPNNKLFVVPHAFIGRLVALFDALQF